MGCFVLRLWESEEDVGFSDGRVPQNDQLHQIVKLLLHIIIECHSFSKLRPFTWKDSSSSENTLSTCSTTCSTTKSWWNCQAQNNSNNWEFERSTKSSRMPWTEKSKGTFRLWSKIMHFWHQKSKNCRDAVQQPRHDKITKITLCN